MAADKRYTRNVATPETGFFLIRLVKGGVWTPARICRDERGWWAEIMGNVRSEPHPDPLRAQDVMKVWLTSREDPITEDEYRRRIALLRGPDAPPLNQAVDLNRMKPLF